MRVFESLWHGPGTSLFYASRQKVHTQGCPEPVVPAQYIYHMKLIPRVSQYGIVLSRVEDKAETMPRSRAR